MNRSAELLLALSEDKEEKKLTVLFLAVVNIVLLRTNLLICGDKERSLAGQEQILLTLFVCVGQH